MSKLCAFTYEWRDNVLQHLHVIANDKSSFKPRLYFFHHATVLREMWLFEDSSGGNPYRELALETLRTIGLLIPTDSDSQGWFNKIRQHKSNVVCWPEAGYGPKYRLYDIDARAGEQFRMPQKVPRRAIARSLREQRMWDGPSIEPSRAVEGFRYWQPRLLALEKAFDNASPRGIKTWWFDRRNKRGWWTFWIAFTSLVLVILGGICSFISMIGTMMSLGEARIANDLARTNIDLAKTNNDIASAAAAAEKRDGSFSAHGTDSHSGCVATTFSATSTAVLGAQGLVSSALPTLQVTITGVIVFMVMHDSGRNLSSIAVSPET